MVFDALLGALTAYNAQPKNTHEAIMDAARAYIGAQAFKETGEFVFGMPRHRLEEEQLRLRNKLLRRQLANLPYSDSEELEDGINDDDEAPTTSKLARIMATRYLERETNPISKVGKYVASSPRTGISAISKFFL